MFSVHCPRHGTEVLLTEDDIRSLERTDAGILVRWRCSCGHAGAHLTGRPRTHRARPALAAC